MDNIKKEISRRNLAKYLGNSIVFLPFMRTLMETQAFGASSAKRAVFFYYPDGIIPEAFQPAEVGTTFTLPAMTAPLKVVQSDIIMLKNVEYLATNSHEGGAHYSLSGCKNTTNRSIDSYLGEKFISQIPVLRLGIGSNYEAGPPKAICWKKTDQVEPMEDHPNRAFNTVFGGGVATPMTPGTTPAVSSNGLSASLKKSLLDDNLEQIKGLQSKLGSIEKEKLAVHIESIRELERRIQAVTNPGTGSGGGATASCDKNFKLKKEFKLSDSNYPLEIHNVVNYNDIADMMNQLAIQALACGATKVVVIQQSHSVSNTRFSGGVPSATGSDHHEYSHYGFTSPTGEKAQQHIKNQAYMMGKFADLIKGMGEIKEGDKSLLYNSAMMAFSEIGESDYHRFDNMGLIVAGQAGGFFKTGRCIDASKKSHNQLLVSMLQAMGLSDLRYGDPTLGAEGMIDALKG